MRKKRRKKYKEIPFSWDSGSSNRPEVEKPREEVKLAVMGGRCKEPDVT